MEKYMYVIYFLFLEMFAKGLSRNISNKIYRHQVVP